MIKVISVLGILMAVMMIAVATIPVPSQDNVEARESAAPEESCPLHEVALDEGYGVTRVGVEHKCLR